MPEMGGCELASRLRLERPDTAVLYMSGYTAEAVIRQGVLDERIAFLPKPVRADALVRKVREVLDAHREGQGGPCGAAPEASPAAVTDRDG